MFPLITSAISGGLGGGIASSLGLGGISSALGSVPVVGSLLSNPTGLVSSLVGNVPVVGSLLSSATNIISNPVGTLTDLGGSAIKTIGGLFGGDNSHIMADRNDVVLGNGASALAILYNHPAKQGGRIIITEPMEVPDMFFDGANWHDSISAIDIANGASITFYEHPNYGGLFDGMNGDNMKSASNPNVNRQGSQNSINLYESWKFWNDRISSFKVTGKATYNQKKVAVSDAPPPPRPQNTASISNQYQPDNNLSSSYAPTNSLTNTTNNTTTEPQKNGSMIWIVFLLLGGFLFKDKIKKML